MSLIAELQRRNVFRVAAGYAVVAWLLVQVSTTVLPQFHAPDWIARWLIVALAVGFLPMLVLAWMFEFTPQGLKSQREADAAGLPSRFRGARANLMLVALLVLGLALFGLGRYSAAPERSGGASGSAASAEPSIAVLPFVNMSAEKDNEYFSDGLSETLLDMLAQVPALKVAARTSSFAFKGKAEDVRGIGAALGVANLLEGSVQKSGGQVRITAQLVRTSDGNHLWSRHYDRELDDVFKIQDEIAREVVTALKLTLMAGDAQRLTQRRTDNVAAYQEYLKGIALMPDRRVADLRAAAAHFERAIELDPGFARAYVGVGDTYALLSEYGSVTDEERRRGQECIERALQLAPDLGEAHTSLAARLATARDFAGAEREYRRAIELAPSYATAYHWYSELLQRGLSRYDEALAMAERAVALDPLSPVLQMNLADMQTAAGHDADARATVTRLAEAHPEYALAHRAKAHYARTAGDLVSALRAMQAHDRADPDAIGYSMGRCQILLDFGAKEALHACVADFARRSPGHPRVLEAQARVAGLDGELEQSLRLLERMPDADAGDHALALLRLGRAREARDLLVALVPKFGGDSVPEVSWQERGLAVLVGAAQLRIEGARDRGRTLIERALATKDQATRDGRAGDPWFEAICLEVLGRREEALAALQREVAAGRFVGLAYLDWEPLLEPLREDPRYDKTVTPARAQAAEQVRLARAAGLL